MVFFRQSNEFLYKRPEIETRFEKETANRETSSIPQLTVMKKKMFHVRILTATVSLHLTLIIKITGLTYTRKRISQKINSASQKVLQLDNTKN